MPRTNPRFSPLRAARRATVALCALGFVAASAGCGPFGYLKKVSKDASRAVADAEAVGGEEYAPYEYWGSVAYLEQAKVMMGYSEYERSFDYGTRSTQLANEAKVKSERVEAGESVEKKDGIAAPDEAAEEGESPTEGADAPAEGGDK